MKVKFIVKEDNPQPLWEADLQEILFKKGDILDITAFRYFRGEEDVEKETIESFDGLFEVIEVVHKLKFEIILSQNTTYKECTIYLTRK